MLRTKDNTLAPLVIEWFAKAGRDLPWRRPGFSAWGVLVSEFMLQQTPVARVIPHLEDWLTRWPTPADLASENSGEAVRAWKNLGYPRRALWLHASAIAIVERHDGEVPDHVDALLALPGVGDYTARAVAAFAYGKREPVVDTNIRRVIARAVRGVGDQGPPQKSDLLDMDALLPDDAPAAQAFNAGMMELGATVCTARTPSCAGCPLASHCAWKRAGSPAYEGPRKAKQKKYEGSDRHVRGLILARLRNASSPVPATEINELWPDVFQLQRALLSLMSDGLACETNAGYTLPS